MGAHEIPLDYRARRDTMVAALNEGGFSLNPGDPKSLDLIEDLGRWTPDEKALAVRILRAKSAREPKHDRELDAELERRAGVSGLDEFAARKHEAREKKA